MSSAHFFPLLVAGFFAWSIYRRVKRNIGKQKLRPQRIIFSLVIFTLISFLIVASALLAKNLNLLSGFGAGILLGALLGFFGLRLTKFETTDEGHFYTPNTYIGSALSLLLIGRMIFNFSKYGGFAPSPGHRAVQSPLTYFVIGLTFGYYLVYYVGLFVHTRDKKNSGA